MDTNSSQSSSKVTYTGGIRSNGGTGAIKRHDNPTDAYNDLYQDIHAKLNGNSSWVQPTTTISNYISKFAPKEDNNDPISYTKHMVDYFNNDLKNAGSKILISNNSTLSQIKNALLEAGLDADHEFTKAHLGIEDPKVLKALSQS